MDLLPVVLEDAPTGLLSINGRTSGTAMINLRAESGGKRKIGELKIGTPVSVAEQKGDACLVEGKGLRGWVDLDYLTLDDAPDSGESGSDAADGE